MVGQHLHVEGDAKIDSALQVNIVELVDETGDTRIRLNANSGSFEMLDNDTLFYQMSVNSSRKTLEYSDDRKIRYITCWDSISPMLKERVVMVERMEGINWVKIREKRSIFSGSTNKFFASSTEHFDEGCLQRIVQETFFPGTTFFCGQPISTILQPFEAAGICVPELSSQNLTRVAIEYDCPSGTETQIRIKNKTGDITITKATNTLMLGENSKGESFNLIKNPSGNELDGTVVTGGEERKIKITSSGDTLTVINYLSDSKYIETVTFFNAVGDPVKLYSTEYCLDEGKVTTTLPDSTFFTLDLCKIIKGKVNKLTKTEKIEPTSYIETYEDENDEKVELEVKPGNHQAVWRDVNVFDWESVLGKGFGIQMDTPQVILFEWKDETNETTRLRINPVEKKSTFEPINQFELESPNGIFFRTILDTPETVIFEWESESGNKSSMKVNPDLDHMDFDVDNINVEAPSGSEFGLDVSDPDGPSIKWSNDMGEEVELDMDLPNGKSEWKGMRESKWGYPYISNPTDELMHSHILDSIELIKLIMDSATGSEVAGIYNPVNHEILFTGDQSIKVTIDGNLCVAGNISAANFPPPIFAPPNESAFSSNHVEFGLASTNQDGLVTVLLPDELLSKDFEYTYQLTVIGSFARAIIERKIENGKFVIRTDQPNTEVSWEVKARRKSIDKASPVLSNKEEELKK